MIFLDLLCCVLVVTVLIFALVAVAWMRDTSENLENIHRELQKTNIMTAYQANDDHGKSSREQQTDRIVYLLQGVYTELVMLNDTSAASNENRMTEIKQTRDWVYRQNPIHLA